MRSDIKLSVDSALYTLCDAVRTNFKEYRPKEALFVAEMYSKQSDFLELINRNRGDQYSCIRSLYLCYTLENAARDIGVKIEQYNLSNPDKKVFSPKNFQFTQESYGTVTCKWAMERGIAGRQAENLEIYYINGVPVIFEIRYPTIGRVCNTGGVTGGVIGAMRNDGINKITEPALELIGNKFGYVIVAPEGVYSTIKEGKENPSNLITVRDSFFRNGGKLVPLFPGKDKFKLFVSEVLKQLHAELLADAQDGIESGGKTELWD